MNALHIAIHYNNIGVTLLEIGHHEECLEIFRGSAELMYIATQSIHQNPHATMLNDTKIQEVLAKLQNVVIRSTIHPKNEDSRRENDCFLYHTAISVSHSKAGKHPPSNCALASATVLFNMALTYHLGSPLPHNLCPSLYNALTLYDMAYSVARRVEKEPGSQRVICAALNNLGHLHHELGRYGTSRGYLDDLSSYIVSLDLFGGDKESKSEQRRFLLNAMFLLKPRGAPAA